MGKSGRSEIVPKNAKNIPTPCTYQAFNDIFGKDAITYSLGSSRRDPPANQIPGPGSYNLKQEAIRESPKRANMGHGQRENIISKEEQNKPGPGHYDSPTRMGEGTKYTIGEKRDDYRNNNVPGVGTYDAKDDLLRSSISTAQMGNTKRQDIVNQNIKN